MAKIRKKWYQSNVYVNLQIKFIQRDIVQFLYEISQDKLSCKPNIIWVAEAISHIYPPERFLNAAYYALQPGGKIVISETNPLNFVSRITTWKHRRSRYREMSKDEIRQLKKGNIFLYPWTFQDPLTGKEVEICNEKLWTPQQLKTMLKSAGFSVEIINFYRFIPDFLMNTPVRLQFWKRMEFYIRKLNLISKMGVRQIIIASKRK